MEGAKNFTLGRLEHSISLLHEYDLRSKGVKNGSASRPELLRELVFKLIK